MLQIAFLLLLCTGALAQVPGLGQCPNVTVVQNFDVSKYTGVWYEAEKYFAIFELGAKCVTANYSLKSDDSVKVVNRQLNSWFGNPSTIEGYANFTNGNTNEGKLSVVFPTVSKKMPAPYWILDTDYTDYAVVFSCSDLALFHAKIVWILTREQNAPKSVLEKAYKVLDKNKISKFPLIKTDQKNC